MIPKKLVILTQYFPPEMGAPQTRLWETALGLQKRGWDISVITAMPNYPSGTIFEKYKGKLSHTEKVSGIQIIRYWLYASNSKKSFPRIISMLSFSILVLCSWYKVRKLKPDYIFTESPPLTLALSGLLLSSISGAKHIMNVSDLWPLSALELGALSKGTLYSILEKLESYLYKKSAVCTGQSSEIIEQLIQKGSQKTVLYRNGVDSKRFIEPLPKGETLKIVYTGLLGVAQGILPICKNVNFQSLNTSFHIYGDGAERKEIELFIKQNPDCAIYYYGKVNREEIPKVLSNYHVTLIPLIKPIFGAIPSKIYESMAASLPIIFAGGGEGANIIKEHQCGWICSPSNYIEISNTIQHIKTISNDEFSQLSKNCRHAANKIFDREIQLDTLHQFLSTT